MKRIFYTIIGLFATILTMSAQTDTTMVNLDEIVWFAVNILCIILWSIKSDWCMVMQYVFWTGNTVYGYNIWKKSIKK